MLATVFKAASKKRSNGVYVGLLNDYSIQYIA